MGLPSSDSTQAVHADLDSFFLSVEAALDSRLRGVPSVCVGDTVVVSASYQARERGIRAGMSTTQARRLEPGLRVVHARIDAYRAVSRELLALLEPLAEGYRRLSIDECSWTSGGSHEKALTMRALARTRFGLPISVGLAPTTLLAKLACSAAKPDGIFEVSADASEAFLAELPARALPGVGPVTAEKLEAAGVFTVRDLQSLNSDRAQMLLGESTARSVALLATGVLPERGEPKNETSGAERTSRDPVAGDEAGTMFTGVLASALHRVVEKARPARSVTVTVRSRSGQTHSATRQLDFATLDVTALTAAAHSAWGSLAHLTVSSLRVAFTLTRTGEQLAFDLHLPGIPAQLPAKPTVTICDIAYAGMRVSHPAFGPGVVKAMRGDSLAVEFADRMRILEALAAPLTWGEDETAPTP